MIRLPAIQRARTVGSQILALALTALVLLPPAVSFAGSGKITSGKFDLSISSRFNAPTATLNALQNRLQQASELLFDATDGQHQFGTIRICNNSRGGRNADIWFQNDGDRSFVSGGCVPGLGTNGCHITLFEKNALADVGANADGRHVIVHEFGHYGYGIFDEYVTPTGTEAVCLAAPFTSAGSLMENFWLRPISEFCVASNHDPDGDTRQDALRGESSWETMKHFFPNLTVPTGLPAAGPLTGAATIGWQVLQPETRMVLVIDRSGSMAFPIDKINNAKAGAKIFTDLASTGDKLGIVSFSDTVTVDFPLTTITAGTKAAAKTAIDRINAVGATNIGGGLRAALNQIIAAGPQGCQQVIVLLTDGIHNSGEHPNSVLTDLKAQGVIVHTVALGGDADPALLNAIAAQTSGHFFSAASGADLLAIFSTLFTESTENGGLITGALQPILAGQTRDTSVTIDAHTPEAKFLITWPGIADVQLTLVAPDGKLITPATPAIQFSSGSNYQLYAMTSVQAGQWIMRITGLGGGPVDVTAQALGVSPEISFTAMSNKSSVVFPEPILVNAIPTALANVVGATVSGTVKRPDGSVVPITLLDDGLPAHGDLQASDGAYSALFSAFNQNGTYTFNLTARSSNAFLFTGEGLFAEPLGVPASEGADPTRPAPIFTRDTAFSVLVSGVPAFVPVTINIKGPDEPHPINPKSKGKVPVAIQATSVFDIATVMPRQFGSAPPGSRRRPFGSRSRMSTATENWTSCFTSRIKIRESSVVKVQPSSPARRSGVSQLRGQAA